MNAHPQFGGKSGQRGSALLIAIFALMLISVVGIALLVSTGSDSALAGNYRTSTSAYYAATAGLEEARGRLLKRNPDFINKTNAYSSIFTGQGIPSFGLTDVVYILNPAAAEVVDPTDATSKYADTEYAAEMGWPLSGANVSPPIASTSPVGPIPAALYKWVRINVVTEKAISVDVNNSGGAYNSIYPLYYTGSGLNMNTTGNNSLNALEITAFAYMPDNSKKILQYLVTPSVVTTYSGSGTTPNFDFPAALTLAGSNVTFAGPGSTDFKINGQDQTPSCSSWNYMVPSIGYTNSFGGDTSRANILGGAVPDGNYQGYPQIGGPPPVPSSSPDSIMDVSSSMQANWLTPSGLDMIAQNITRNADVVINADASGNDITTRAPTMSPANPLTIVVNGDLDLNAWHQTGYGLLLVTGTLKYDPDASWDGIVLIIGQGSFVSTKSGSGQINGAVFIAKTRDSSGILLSTLGSASFSQTGGINSGKGIYYNSCWIRGSATAPGAQGPLNFKVLAFREITQ